MHSTCALSLWPLFSCSLVRHVSSLPLRFTILCTDICAIKLLVLMCTITSIYFFQSHVVAGFCIALTSYCAGDIISHKLCNTGSIPILIRIRVKNFVRCVIHIVLYTVYTFSNVDSAWQDVLTKSALRRKRARVMLLSTVGVCEPTTQAMKWGST